MAGFIAASDGDIKVWRTISRYHLQFHKEVQQAFSLNGNGGSCLSSSHLLRAGDGLQSISGKPKLSWLV